MLNLISENCSSFQSSYPLREGGRKSGRRWKKDERGGRNYSHSYERQWLYTSAYALGTYACGSSCAPRILYQLSGKSVKKSFGKKTGWRPHNGGWDYVGALGIPYSGSASLNRISERISACLRDRALAIYSMYSHPLHM